MIEIIIEVIKDTWRFIVILACAWVLAWRLAKALGETLK